VGFVYPGMATVQGRASNSKFGDKVTSNGYYEL